MALLLLTVHRSLLSTQRLLFTARRSLLPSHQLFKRFLFTAFLLLLPLNLCESSTGREFQIGEYRALSLLGEARLLPDAAYVSFTGDFGFSTRLPPTEAVDEHVATESALLANFQLSVINLEFMLPGSSGREADRRIDKVAIDILRRSGFDVISRANNHALDHGGDGVAYNTRILQEAGFKMIGPRGHPVHTWEAAGRKIAIFSLTDYTDRPDPASLILKINEGDLRLIKRESSSADFRIAFVHLGSMSVYPSAHEREQVKRILDAGVDLVVCTGSHFIKGFVDESQKPVVYGLGNHIFSNVDKDTEPVGMHFVAGFKGRKLIQLFVVPFHNNIMRGISGPLNEAEFTSFQTTLANRSTSDSSRYYSDQRTVTSFRERLRELSFSELKNLKLRHFVYATGILFHNYPTIVIGAGLIVLVSAAVVTHCTALRRRRRMP